MHDQCDMKRHALQCNSGKRWFGKVLRVLEFVNDEHDKTSSSATAAVSTGGTYMFIITIPQPACQKDKQQPSYKALCSAQDLSFTAVVEKGVPVTGVTERVQRSTYRHLRYPP